MIAEALDCPNTSALYGDGHFHFGFAHARYEEPYVWKLDRMGCFLPPLAEKVRDPKACETTAQRGIGNSLWISMII